MNSNKHSIMTLYTDASDLYSHKVRIVLAEKGVTYNLVDIHSSDVTMKSLSAFYNNPYSTVPTLLDRDVVLYRSDIIMEYLEERFPHPPLMPVYPIARGRSRQMIYIINKEWYTAVNSILESTKPEEVKKSRIKLINYIISIVPILSKKSFFFNEGFSLVDCCIIPILWRLPRLSIKLPKKALPVIEYAEKMFNRKSFQNSLLEFEKNMISNHRFF